MRRRSSSSDEDEDEDAQAPSAEAPPPTQKKDSRPSFTTAKFDLSRHSDTLDRRKGDKIPLPAHTPSNGWKTPRAPREGLSKESSLSDVASADNMPGLRGWRRPSTRSPWSCSLLTLSATLLAIITLLAIVHSFVARQLDTKGCEMYWSRSIFFKFDDFDTEHTRFASKYSLYIHREGGFDEDSKVETNRAKAWTRLTLRRSKAFPSFSYLEMLEVTSKRGLWDPSLPNFITILLRRTRRR